MKPDYIEARVNLGVALAEKGKIDQGISQFQQVLQLEPNSAEAHNDLGIALGMKGNFNEAVLHYRQAINLKPDWPLPLNGLAWILATYPDPNMRDAKQAIELAERAAAMTNHQDAIILNTLAAAYAAAGRFSDAVATAQKAMDLAVAQRNDHLADSIRPQLEMYKQQKIPKN
jgi:spermidine synthase